MCLIFSYSIQEERAYIEYHIPSRNEGTELPFPPVIQMLKTPAFLALIVVHFGNNWGLYTLLTEIPTYLNNIQHFSLTTVSKISFRDISILSHSKS
jgi:hypothetical protein